MAKTRLQIIGSILKGLAAGVALTLGCMAVVAAMEVYLSLTDAWLHALNQVMKLLAMLAGTAVAVGRGGQRGFVTGMAVSMLYMILGYALYLALGGGAFDAAGMLGEILIGAAVGGISGSVLSNLPARRSRRATTA